MELHLEEQEEKERQKEKVRFYAKNLLEFQTPFSFCSERKCWLSGLEFTKCLSEQHTGKKTLGRLLFQIWLFDRQLAFEILEHTR